MPERTRDLGGGVPRELERRRGLAKDRLTPTADRQYEDQELDELEGLRYAADTLLRAARGARRVGKWWRRRRAVGSTARDVDLAEKR